MCKIGLSVVMIFIAASVLGAESEINTEHTIKLPYARVLQYVENHPNEVVESTHVHIVSRNGNKIRIIKDTLKSTYDFTVTEKSIKQPDKMICEYRFYENHFGIMEDYFTIVTFTDKKDSTGVDIDMYAKVGIDVPNILVRINLLLCSKGLTNYLDEIPPINVPPTAIKSASANIPSNELPLENDYHSDIMHSAKWVASTVGLLCVLFLLFKRLRRAVL